MFHYKPVTAQISIYNNFISKVNLFSPLHCLGISSQLLESLELYIGLYYTLLMRITTLAWHVIRLTKPHSVATTDKCETTGLWLHHLQKQSGFTLRHGFNSDLSLKGCFKLRGMDCMACSKDWNQDSTSSQSWVHLGLPPKHSPLKKGPPNIKTERPKSQTGSPPVFVDTHWLRRQKCTIDVHICSLHDTPRAVRRPQGNRKHSQGRCGDFLLSKKKYVFGGDNSEQ